MIFGIGTDIVEINRIADVSERRGIKFAQKILTDTEYRHFENSGFSMSKLAKYFAGKEAAAKALGTGFSQGLSLKHIEIGHQDSGKPTLNFMGQGAKLIKEFGIVASHLSLSDEKQYAIAYVCLETGK